MLKRRGKTKDKWKMHHCISDIYDFYAGLTFKIGKKQHLESDYAVSRMEFRAIMLDFNKMLIAELIKGKEIRLPFNLGFLVIKKIQPKAKVVNGEIVENWRPIDRGATWKLWNEDPEAREKKILVRHQNYHTNGFVCKWKWIKDRPFINKTKYSLKISRPNKLLLARIMKDPNNNNDYLLL